jgi:hypothetical protein
MRPFTTKNMPDTIDMDTDIPHPRSMKMLLDLINEDIRKVHKNAPSQSRAKGRISVWSDENKRILSK